MGGKECGGEGSGGKNKQKKVTLVVREGISTGHEHPEKERKEKDRGIEGQGDGRMYVQPHIARRSEGVACGLGGTDGE